MKRIICCCDGTWNQPGQKDRGKVTMTNVQKIVHLICSTDTAGVVQLAHYFPGVGTSGNWWQRLMGGVAGDGLDKYIINAYRFILLNYEPGDEIFLFGFSRGAYTARSIAGFIVNCGILRKEHYHELQNAFNFYRDRSDLTNPNSPQAVAFREKYSHPPAVYFIGVWDTVGDLGIPIQPFMFLDKDKYRFHDTQLSSIVRYAYHALATDEHRAIFNATLWELSEKGKLLQPGAQTVDQHWFSGSHSNVGGGYLDRGLSDHTLEWMVHKAAAAGLSFNLPPAGFYQVDVVNGELRDSNTFWWALLHYFIPFYRVIFRFDPIFLHQQVAGSVYDRMRQNAAGYAPPNIPAATSASIALRVGQSATISVNAFTEYSGDVLVVSPGQQYHFDCSSAQRWTDWCITNGPDGYVNPLAQLIGLRVKGIRCFKLCGVYGRDSKSAFGIGEALNYTAVQDGEIAFFANDSIGFYWNNKGNMNVQIQRIS